jgi:hypothetical protein
MSSTTTTPTKLGIEDGVSELNTDAHIRLVYKLMRLLRWS